MIQNTICPPSRLQLLNRKTVMNKNPLINQRVEKVVSISSPHQVIEELPQSENSQNTVLAARKSAIEIISPNSTDDRLLVILGPCSIHDSKAALEYAEWLKLQRDKYSAELEIIMRTYLEKPRTTIGWKGIINDPHLNGTAHMDEGVRIARNLLLEITSLGVPASTELLDIRTPQYISDLISWGAIGARTIESQLHRELVSGVSFPVGLKNGTGGGLQIALDAMESAGNQHNFIGIDMDGQTAIIKTSGNHDTHLILRGSSAGPNYDKESVAKVIEMLKNAGKNPNIMIDCSHANSNKDFRNQPKVASNVAEQISSGNKNIVGVMIESNLVEGNQPLGDGVNLTYGQSITDACVGLSASETMLEELAQAVKTRRK